MSLFLIDTTPVLAGFKVVHTNFIISNPDGSGVAGGQIGSARNSDNETEAIACTVWTSGGGSAATCSVTDRAGTSRSCFTVTAQYIELLGSLTDDTFIMFEWDQQGWCTFLMVGADSAMMPKAP